MKLGLAIVFSTILLIAIVAIIVTAPQSRVVVYNCSVAEISPDFTVEARNECRKLRAK